MPTASHVRTNGITCSPASMPSNPTSATGRRRGRFHLHHAVEQTDHDAGRERDQIRFHVVAYPSEMRAATPAGHFGNYIVMTTRPRVPAATAS